MAAVTASNLLTIVCLMLLEVSMLRCHSKSIGYSDDEMECFSQNKIYHRETDKCYKVLTRGPCEEGYWFVLEKPKKSHVSKNQDLRISGVCVKEKCPEGGYFWPRTKTCVPPKDKNQLCGNSSNEELLNNIFGEAECMCARDPVRARLNGDFNNPCYQLYTQGPCRDGEVLGFLPQDSDKATCIKNKCHEETVRRRLVGKLPKYGVLAPWNNGSCYELGTQGPCQETFKFKVHQITMHPDCVSLTNAIFDLEKPQKCYQDENGDCQKRIESSKAQSADRYKEELLGALSAARKKRNSQ